ncbi:MAG: glutamine ABC transporter substrate-binding protein GlnH [Desulfonatronovibrionaceae bacterium]
MKRILSLFVMCVFMVTAGSAFAGEKITVAHDTNFMPFEFKKDGEYVGFDIDLWKAIAEESGIDYKLQAMDFNGIIPALQSDNVDVGIAGITVTSEREEAVDFSYPYYQSGLRILVREDEEDIKELDDLAGKKVATKLATSSVDFLKKEMPDLDPKLFPNIDGAFMELRSGGVDAVLFDAPVVQHYANTSGDGAVRTVGPVYEGQYYGIAFPTGSELRDKVDVALLKLIEDGTYAELYEKWFGEAPK